VVQACQPGRTSTADTTAEKRTSAVPDQPDNSARGTSSNVPDNQAASQDSDALISLRLYGDDYDADEEGGEEEEETVLLTSQRDDQNAS
jgi:hypothetical protein